MWRVRDVARVGYGTGSVFLGREENRMELVGRCEVLYFGVVLSDIFIMGGFRREYHAWMFVYLLEAMIWKPAVCTGGLIWEHLEGADDGFDCSCTVS